METSGDLSRFCIQSTKSSPQQDEIALARNEQFSQLGFPVTEVDKFSRNSSEAQTLYLKRLLFSELCSF